MATRFAIPIPAGEETLLLVPMLCVETANLALCATDSTPFSRLWAFRAERGNLGNIQARPRWVPSRLRAHGVGTLAATIGCIKISRIPPTRNDKQ